MFNFLLSPVSCFFPEYLFFLSEIVMPDSTKFIVFSNNLFACLPHFMSQGRTGVE